MPLNQTMSLSYIEMSSPVGQLKLIATDTHLVAILWENDTPQRVKLAPARYNPDLPVLLNTQQQLHEYFAGDRWSFDIPLAFHGTDFQQEVWQALLTIPYGETRSYLDIAQQIGRPKAVRAVGAANGKNPISIIAPCHRVIGSNGHLVGFAGGLANKTTLLHLEQQQSFTLR